MLTSASLVKWPDGDNIVFSEDGKLELTCSAAELEVAKEIQWVFRGSDGVEKPLDPASVTVTDTASRLTLLKGETSGNGVYACILDDQELAWSVAPSFSLDPMAQSVSVVDGESARIHCRLRLESLQGGGVPQFSWSREVANVTEALGSTGGNSSSRIQVLSESESHSVLKIVEAENEDRGVYRCMVSLLLDSGEVVESTEETLLRVKDKHAALYPFIGLVVEVIVLCLIIYGCEKRRSSHDSVEDLDDVGAPQSKGSVDESLRQRKA